MLIKEMRHGSGKNIQKNGTVYSGYWVEDKYEGVGRIICSDGDMQING